MLQPSNYTFKLRTTYMYLIAQSVLLSNKIINSAACAPKRYLHAYTVLDKTKLNFTCYLHLECIIIRRTEPRLYGFMCVVQIQPDVLQMDLPDIRQMSMET